MAPNLLYVGSRCTMWVVSPWGFSEVTIQPARHECHACCPLQAEKPGIQPVVGNTHGTHVEQVVSTFQKILSSRSSVKLAGQLRAQKKKRNHTLILSLFWAFERKPCQFLSFRFSCFKLNDVSPKKFKIVTGPSFFWYNSIPTLEVQIYSPSAHCCETSCVLTLLRSHLSCWWRAPCMTTFSNAFPTFTIKAQKLGKVAFKSSKKAQNVSMFTFFGAPTCPADVKLAGHGFLTSGLDTS